MRLAWMTDIHLDFLESSKREAFFAALRAQASDGLLISGDIAEAPTLVAHLEDLAAAVQRPIYFVLGNHDFYRGSFAAVRSEVRRLCQRAASLIYLPDARVVPLTSKTALVGHDGWGDSRLGDFARTPVALTDHVLIEDLRYLEKPELGRRLRALGDEAAGFVREVLPGAFECVPRVVFVTHVPPFKETCWYQGRIGNDDWLPFFTCQAVGEALIEVMQARPDCRLTVLCGHTHQGGTAAILPNLVVHTGAAEYGDPVFERILDVV